MLGLFSNRVHAEIMRAKTNKNRHSSISRVRLEIKPTINGGPVREHITIQRPGSDSESFKFFIPNLTEFKSWAFRIAFEEFLDLKLPFDFATAAMIEILNGLGEAKLNDSSEAIVKHCFARVSGLGKVVEQTPKRTGRKSAMWRDFEPYKGEILIRHDAEETWSFKKSDRRSAQSNKD